MSLHSTIIVSRIETCRKLQQRIKCEHLDFNICKSFQKFKEKLNFVLNNIEKKYDIKF